MFNRSTKMTALLVAAASVMSTVPAMAAEKAELKTQTGTFTNAIAFGDGKYLYQGYKDEDKDDDALYLFDGKEDKKLDDANELGVKFGKKYVTATEGSDDYLIDLTNGKVDDDKTVDEIKDDAAEALQKVLRKVDRYDVNDSRINIDGSDLSVLPSNNFAETWYSYEATTSGGTTILYTDGNGKYVDAGIDLNLYAYNGTNNSLAKIEKLDKEYSDVTATSISDANVIAQDENYIYRTVKVHLEGAFDVKGNPLTEVKCVQKISKEQGKQDDEAYKPKTTETYMLGEKEKFGGNDDVEKAYNILFNNLDEKDAISDTKVVAKDGVLYVTFTKGDKVKTVKLYLKSERLDKGDGGKLSFRVVKQDGDTDEDATAWSIDVNGNVWALHKGEIMKSEKGGDFEVVYTCDRSFNKMDVYDKDNLIVWENGEDVFAVVTKATTDTPVEPPVDEKKTGWDQLADGTWNLYDANGVKLTGWQLVGGVWYYLDPTTAVMKTGWHQDPDGTWYFLQASGAMKTGWYNENGTWYYLKPNGAMATGWYQDTTGTWYYSYASGAMAYNTVIDGYTLGASGAWVR